MNIVKKDSTDITRYIMLVDSTDGTPETGYTISSLDLQYTRERSTPSVKADAVALLSVDASHLDNRAIEVDSTNSPGLYRVDWPDAAFATGADKVILVVIGTGLHPSVEEIQLVDIDVEDSVRAGLTGIPNVTPGGNGGLPTVDANNRVVGIQGTKNTLDDLNDVSSATVNAQCDTALTDYDGPTYAELQLEINTVQTDIAALNDVSSADVNAACDTALTDYDPPTKAELDSGLAGLNDVSTAEVNAQCDTALADYDPPTKTELDAGLAGLNDPTADAIADAVWDEAISGHTTSTTFGGFLQDIAGSGFTAALNSLVAIKNYLVSIVTPVVTVEDTASNLTTGSFTARMVEKVRRATDEPATNSKYSDSDLIGSIEEAWAEVWSDVARNSQSPFVVYYDIVIAVDTREYLLPPSVGRVLRLGKVNTDSDLVEWETDQKGFYAGGGYGFQVQGNLLKLGRNWRVGETMRLEYVPSGECSIFTGTFTSGTTPESSKVVTVPGSPTSGSIETRPNAYAGYYLRITPDVGTAAVADDPTTFTQERLITEWNSSTREATIAVAFSPELVALGSDLNFEVVPYLYKLFEQAISLRTALTVLGNEGSDTRYTLLMTEYRQKIRALRLEGSQKTGRRAGQFEGDVPENRRRSRWPFLR